jgi:hypothetical protein
MDSGMTITCGQCGATSDIDACLKFTMRRNDPGGRSRSPAFGKWKSDDERE